MVRMKIRGFLLSASLRELSGPSALQHHNCIITRQENQITSYQIYSVFPLGDQGRMRASEGSSPPASCWQTVWRCCCWSSLFARVGSVGIRSRQGGGTKPSGPSCFSMSLLSQEWTFSPCMLPSWEVTLPCRVFAKTDAIQIHELLPRKQELCLHHLYVSSDWHSTRHSDSLWKPAKWMNESRIADLISLMRRRLLTFLHQERPDSVSAVGPCILQGAGSMSWPYLHPRTSPLPKGWVDELTPNPFATMLVWLLRKQIQQLFMGALPCCRLHKDEWGSYPYLWELGVELNSLKKERETNCISLLKEGLWWREI